MVLPLLDLTWALPSVTMSATLPSVLGESGHRFKEASRQSEGDQKGESIVVSQVLPYRLLPRLLTWVSASPLPRNVVAFRNFVSHVVLALLCGRKGEFSALELYIREEYIPY